MIFKVLSEEEDKFNRTIDQGLAILADMEEDMNKKGEKVLSGDNAFKLYDTYGFPIDLTREILEEKNLGIDEDGFNAAMKRQKEQARAARKTTNYMGADVTVYQSIDPAITTEFIGYDRLTAESEISVLTTEDEIVEALTDGQTGTIITKETPFYGTMGGQEGDFGQITAPDGSVFEVKDTIHLQGGKIGHVGVVVKGMFEVGEKVTMSVDKENRELTSRNHSATHLLHKALRTVLGSHVEQAGSLVTRDRLRFDFTHFSAMTPEEYIASEMVYPSGLLEKNVSGYALCEFTIDKEGVILRPHILRSTHPEFAEEALRIVKGMPKWSPALVGGKPADSNYTLYVPFRPQLYRNK